MGADRSIEHVSRADGKVHVEFLDRSQNELNQLSRNRRMQILDMLVQTGGLQSIAKELGITEAQAASGAQALAPAILGGMQKQEQTNHPLNFSGLGGLLEQVLKPQATDLSEGNDVLGQIFGSKDISRAVTQNAASQTGLDQSVLKKMLPMLAMLIAGYVSKQSTGQSSDAGSGLGSMLGGLLSGGLGSLGQSGESAGSSSKQSSAQGIAAMFDMNRDGNALDDILRMVGKSLRS